MSQADPALTFRTVALAPVTLVIVVVRAFLGSLLGISTASIFGVFALVFFADLSLGVAITGVALGMNAMLLSLVTLGNHAVEDDF
ncbi:MAG: hypothetical protein AAGH83_11180 [Pseudomonadota bacterium]